VILPSRAVFIHLYLGRIQVTAITCTCGRLSRFKVCVCVCSEVCAVKYVEVKCVEIKELFIILHSNR